jgi:hypothetical protein
LILINEILVIFLIGKFLFKKVKKFYLIESVICAICIEDILASDLIDPILYKNVKERLFNVLISERPDREIHYHSRCLQDMEGCITKLNCGHFYHGKCFSEYVKIGCKSFEPKVKCPICRVEAS